jgi:hypothetical protein
MSGLSLMLILRGMNQLGIYNSPFYCKVRFLESFVGFYGSSNHITLAAIGGSFKLGTFLKK